ncbi:MAG: HAMP domain-containing protein [Methanomicrobiales archaeon]|nr:HAMP domain-containing protein [Methanomicrobiales archaeon]
MSELSKKDPGLKGMGMAFQIPIFYKLMVSMLFVAVLPLALLGIVFMGDAQSLASGIGLQNAIFVLTLLTLAVVVMWSFFLASSITSPIVKLSQVANSVSTGDLNNSDIDIMSNDEIGELAVAFNRMVNSYKILDTLARDDMN